MTDNDVYEEHIEELCEELQPFLEAELDAGNTVIETWKGNWPIENCLYILLKKPFQDTDESLPEGVRVSKIGKLYYWENEILCDRTNHVLASQY